MQTFAPRLIRSWTSRGLACLLACAVLAGCAEDGDSDGDRRFANQPNTEVAVTTAATVDPTATPVVPTESASGQARSPLDIRGAPSIVYTLSGNAILAIDTTNPEGIWTMPVGEGTEVIDLVSSPGGDRIATLERKTGTSDGQVVIRRHNGEEVSAWPIAWPAAGKATPAATGDVAVPIGTIAWASGGESLLVSMTGTHLVSISLGGAVTAIDVPENVHTIVAAAESPAGSDIGVLDVDEEGNGRIMVIDPGADTPHARQVAPPRADTDVQGSVTSFSWLPDGSGFAYVLADDVTDGALFSQPLRGGQRTLVASPGRGGPAARIVDFALSPQGDVVAYVIGTPEESGIGFNSLWVRPTGAGEPVRIDTQSLLPVSDLWWTDAGLAWVQDPASIAVAPPDGPVAMIPLAPRPADGTPAASPVASPIVSPASTPAAIPIAPAASPVTASPVASPIG